MQVRISRLLKFLVFFYRLRCICHQNTPKLYLLFLLWAYHPNTCITNASKICQFLRFSFHPYKLATLRAAIGFIITSCYCIILIKITVANCYVTKKRLWPAINFLMWKWPATLKRLGRPGLESDSARNNILRNNKQKPETTNKNTGKIICQYGQPVWVWKVLRNLCRDFHHFQVLWLKPLFQRCCLKALLKK